MYVALYRKWRPKKFDDICGQEHITVSLKNQIKANRISHAYLFCGTRGTGKTTAAKILAKAVNCHKLKDGNPCEECESCKAIDEGNSIDVFEIDAASNRGIDNIRDLREAVKFTPIGKYKLYIIDEVHMLTNEAFNALLKTLEEPPAYVIFVLATTEPHKLPATILSRCQRYDFKRISPKCMSDRLSFISKEEGIKINKEALELIVRNSDGAMRDAISIMDQCAVYSNKDITVDDVSAVLGIVNDRYLFEVADAILKEDIVRIMKLLAEISDEGKDMQQFTRDLQMHYRNLLMANIVARAEDVIDLSIEKIDLLKKQSKNYTKESILSELSAEMNWSPDPLLLLEIALINMSKLSKDISYEGLVARIATLEKVIANGEISVTKVQHKTEQVSDDEEKYPKVTGTDGDAFIELSSSLDDSDEVEGQEEVIWPSAEDEGKIAASDPSEESNIDSKSPDNELSGIGERITESWDEFVKEFGLRKKMILRTYLSSCKPIMVDEHRLLLCFKHIDYFFKEALEENKLRKEIEDMAEEYFGISILVKPVFEEDLEKKGTDDDGLTYDVETACSKDDDGTVKEDLDGPQGDSAIKSEGTDIPDKVSEEIINGTNQVENNNIIADENYVVAKAIEIFGENLVEVVKEE